MTSKLIKVQFCFPRVPRTVQDRKVFVQALMAMMQKNGSIEYAGYLHDKDLQDDLLVRLDGFDRTNYRLLSGVEKGQIAKAISSSLEKCYRALPHPEKPIRIFIFPWFPDAEDRNAFGGVDAVAVHESVMHLFIASDSYTPKTLKETVAHEYNHLVFYHYQRAKNYTLLEHIVMEGLAENFREDVVGGAMAPWARALEKQEAYRTFSSLGQQLGSRSSRLHKRILFGGGRFKRWAGYSIGYWLIKDFRKSHTGKSWTDIVRMKADALVPYK